MTQSQNITHINNAAEFDQALQAAGDKFVLVDFWAEWCGPCRFSSPIIDRIADNLGAQVNVVSVNVDDNQELAMRYQVFSIPMFMLFKQGKDQPSVTMGFRPEPAMLDWLQGEGVDVSAMAADKTVASVPLTEEAAAPETPAA